jgi:hypothetical protein
MLLRRAKLDVTAHGFSSSFRDWAGKETHFPHELAEHALERPSKPIGRSDARERRRALRGVWARHCENGAKILLFRPTSRRPAAATSA